MSKTGRPRSGRASPIVADLVSLGLALTTFAVVAGAMLLAGGSS